MHILRIGFLATRTDNFQPTVDFFRDVLDLPEGFSRPDHAGLTLPTGPRDFVEVYGPTMRDPDLLPHEVTGLLVAFVVADVQAAFDELVAKGVKPHDHVYWAADDWGWFFFDAPDGQVYAIMQTPE